MSSIHLQLRDGERALEPGAPIDVVATWSDVQGHEQLAVSLLWYTQGKGSEDTRTVARQVLQLHDASGRAELSFEGPLEPWSFSGRLVSLVWAIEGTLEPGGAVHRVELVIAPEAREVLL